MIKVGDRLTIDGKLVEVTNVMNDKCYAYKPVTEVEKEEITEVQTEKLDETPVEAPKRRRRKA